MCSFRGSYANRGNGTELSSSDVLAGLESPAGTGRLRRRRRNRPAADRREIGTIDTKRPGPLGASVHNVLDKTSMIPAVGAHIPNFFVGTFDFSKALFYNEIKGGRIT